MTVKELSHQLDKYISEFPGAGKWYVVFDSPDGSEFGVDVVHFSQLTLMCFLSPDEKRYDRLQS